MKDKIIKMFKLFNTRQRNTLIILTFAMLLNAILELLGVSIIIPLVNVILQPEELISEPLVATIMNYFHMNIQGFVILICVFVILIYILKNIFLIAINNFQYKFTYYGQRDMSNRLMKCYLLQDYNFHVAHNSAELIRDISSDVSMFYTTVLAFLQLISELIVCTALVIFLTLTDLLITIGVAVALLLMVVLFMGSYRHILVELGNQRRQYSFRMTKCMQQGFGGIKEIKVANTENYFLNEFAEANAKNAEANRKNLFLNAIPKPVMEALCISGLMVVVCFKILIGGDSTSFISTLAVFAVAAFKLLPSVNKISGYIGNIMHNGVVVDQIYSKMQNVDALEHKVALENTAGKMELKEGVTVHDLSFRYNEGAEHVLENVSFCIKKNQSVAFIGPSGAGKTTIVDIILGLLEPSHGEVLVDQKNIEDHVRNWRNIIGYIPQNIYMLDDDIRNNITFGHGIEDTNDEAVWEALEEAQLKEFVEKLPKRLDTMIGEAGVRLSGGQRQRIGIARALYRKPQLLILDEATSALDTETEAAVMSAIERLQGKITMIIIAHRLSTIENCDAVYEVDNKCVSRRKEV